MYRRRPRPTREIAFSFDSFLDVVCNVVGIIIRLILVAWVGARCYKGPPPPPLPTPAAPSPLVLEDPPPLPLPADPLSEDLEKQRQQLAQARAQLLEQLHTAQQTKDKKTQAANQLAALQEQLQLLQTRRQELESKAKAEHRQVQPVVLALADLRSRGQKLTEEIEALKKLPPAKQTLRYRTPVSAPLQVEELMFECQNNHVTLIDIGAMMQEVERKVRDKAEQLKYQWEVQDLTEQVGAFKLRYTVERNRGVLDGMPTAGIKPTEGGRYSYGLSGWEVIPIQSDRGETLEQAVKPGSQFRRVLDAIDPAETAVTFCVYPDSFPIYRKVRDLLAERGVTVAARPLPPGAPISASRHGSVSRGQ